MKKISLFTVIFLASLFAISQQHQLKNFDKVELNNINGSVNIQLGKIFNIDIIGIDKNDSLITIKVLPEYCLVITLKNGLSWDLMKKINLKINITMPEISKLHNNSNADITINNFRGRYIDIENNGNGDVTLEGTTVDSLNIQNNGNGNTIAKNIEAKKANIIKNGNGNIEIKTNEPFIAKLAGNGDVVNFGKAKGNILKQSGNGKVIYKN